MNVESIKTKPIMERGSGGGSMAVGTKIIIRTDEVADLSIIEIQKLESFLKTLRP